MTFTTLDTVLYTLAFLVPGFIINSIFSRFCSEDDQQPQLLLLRFLTFSAINYGLCFVLIYLVLKADIFVLHPILTAVVWFFIVFVSPVVLGFLFGFLEQRNILPELFRGYGIDITGLDNLTAWDKSILSIKNPRFVLVSLTGGMEVRGMLGANSLASKQSKGGDIYLEKVMRADPSDPSGPWVYVPDSSGIWIKGSEIKHVEFWG